MFNQSPDHQSLSLCMIVKNEEQYLADCLESVRDVVQQIVIVDTGSTDSTMEIAQKYGAEVHCFGWVNDFAVARNESIKYATGDWILWLDADETLLPESKPELLALLKPEKKPVIYGVHIHNIKPDGTYSLSGAHRLFNNYQGIRFSGRIHEQVSPSVSRLGGEERDSSIILHHVGYSFQGARAEQKNERNRHLLLREVSENPGSAYAHYTLAQHYGLNNDHKLAIKSYRKAYALNQFDKKMKASLCNAMSESLIFLGRYSEAKRYIKQSLALQPVQSGAHYLQYKLAIAQNKIDSAIYHLQKLLTSTKVLEKKGKVMSTDILIPKNKIHYTLGNLYEEKGQGEEALSHYEIVRETNPRHKELLHRMIALYGQSGNLESLKNILKEYLEIEPEDAQKTELLGLTYIKLKEFDNAAAVYEKLYAADQNNTQVKNLLLGLYGKLGDHDKIQSLMR